MDAVSASAVVARALHDNPFHENYPDAVIAVGKAASAMAHALVERCPRAAHGGVVIGSHGSAPAPFLWHPSAHPVPDDRSRQAARLALATARGVPADGRLLVMVSGGSSALMAESVDGVPFGDKQVATRQLLAAGAEISALNCVRKHLSTVKGGRLAEACEGAVQSWLLSDVVSDDPGVIGSGPTVPDRSTYADALAVIDRYGGPDRYPASVVAHLSRGAAGAVAETPKAASDLPRSEAQVIGGASDALEGAARAAQALGYDVVRRNEPVVGEAREAARAHLDWIRRTIGEPGRPMCVLSSGETTARIPTATPAEKRNARDHGARSGRRRRSARNPSANSASAATAAASTTGSGLQDQVSLDMPCPLPLWARRLIGSRRARPGTPPSVDRPPQREVREREHPHDDEDAEVDRHDR